MTRDPMTNTRPVRRRPAARPSTLALGLGWTLALGAAFVLGPTAVVQAEPVVAVFLKSYCTDCHGADDPDGNLRLAGVGDFAALGGETWSRIRERVQLGEMPPPEGLQPDTDERQAVLEWITHQLRQSGAIVEDKLTLPNYGNYVDHAALFNEQPRLAPATEVRLWRLRPAAYGQRIRGTQPFSMLPDQHYSDYSTLYRVDESAAEIILRNAQNLVERQTAFKQEGGKLVPVDRQTEAAFLPLLDPKNPPSDEVVRAAVVHQFQRTIDRQPTEEELDRIVALMHRIAEDVNREQAVRAALTVPLLKPEAVYRLELGAGPVDEHGRRRLSPHEIAYALSYALSHDRPHRYNLHPLLQAAEGDRLASREQVAQVVEQVLEQPLDKTPRLLEFFDEFFDYQKAVGVFKEQPSFADHLVRDTAALIKQIVERDENVLYELLTTGEAHIAREDLARIYGLSPDYKSTGEKFVTLPPRMRAGILTQPSWLIAHSGNFDNDPVHRGKWVRERLLGSTVPDLPVSVDAVVPDDPDKTLRERYEVTRAEYCWKCHQRMNPLGMPFEAYDHFGRLRTRELEQPVRTDGAITQSGEASLDGPVADAFELIERLAQSERVEQVFVRHVFRFYLGRNETLRDAQTLQQAHQAYRASGGSYKALVTSLLSSDSFLYRMNPELPESAND